MVRGGTRVGGGQEAQEASCRDRWEHLQGSPNDGVTIELCVSHETLRETAPFVIRARHGNSARARVHRSFFSAMFPSGDACLNTLGFACESFCINHGPVKWRLMLKNCGAFKSGSCILKSDRKSVV